MPVMSQQRGNRPLNGNQAPMNGNQALMNGNQAPMNGNRPVIRYRGIQPVGCCQCAAIVFMDKVYEAHFRCPKHQEQQN